MPLQRLALNFRGTEKSYAFQWHITSRCEGDCKFCYMKDSQNYQNELKNELDLDQCLKIVDEFSLFLKKKNAFGNVMLTGGDPLLRQDSRFIMGALRNRGINIVILGNPHLIWEETAKNLSRLGVKHYQLSIDGLEKTHDFFRGEGSFKKTWEAVDTLKRNGISVGISYTLSATNYLEVEEVIKLCAEHGVNSFRPTRLVPEGRGKAFTKDILSPEQYQHTLASILKELSGLLITNNILIEFLTCDGLRYSTIMEHRGNPLPPYLMVGMNIPKGCDTNLIAMVPDGTLYVCRRLPIKIGNILEMSIEDAYNSSLALKLRDKSSYEECGHCKYLELCRGGCPSVTYAMTGSPFHRDPHCWQEIKNSNSELTNNNESTPKIKDSFAKNVFRPLRVGNLELTNRVWRSATFESAANSDGSPTDKHQNIYSSLSKGGCGLIITGASFISTNSQWSLKQNGIDKDSLIEKWGIITSSVHKMGGKIAMQITHQSLDTIPIEGNLASASSNVIKKGGKSFYYRELEEGKIWKVINQYKKAAVRVAEAGFDAVQLQIAHGYLLNQFISPFTNTRIDQWGGSPENRLRIVIEIVRAIKEELGNEFPILAKIGISDFVEGGLSKEETVEIIKILSSEGIRAFELSCGLAVSIEGIFPPERSENYLTKDNGEYFFREGEYIRSNTPNIVIGICGGVRSREKIVDLLEHGFDFVSLSRPFIREPDLIERMKKGQETAKCTSCHQCLLNNLDNSLCCSLEN